MDNQIDVFGKTFLASTLGCARCHDHKFDAISTKDYYALKGFLQSSRFQVACVDPPEQRDDIVAGLEKNRSNQWDVLKQICASGDRLPVSRLAEYLLAVLEDPEFKAKAKTAGFIVGPRDAKATAARWRSDDTVLYPILQEAGLVKARQK